MKAKMCSMRGVYCCTVIDGQGPTFTCASSKNDVNATWEVDLMYCREGDSNDDVAWALTVKMRGQMK